jgi:hypothetical protein
MIPMRIPNLCSLRNSPSLASISCFISRDGWTWISILVIATPFGTVFRIRRSVHVLNFLYWGLTMIFFFDGDVGVPELAETLFLFSTMLLYIDIFFINT